MSIEVDQATITPAQFFSWVTGQEERYELVNGEIVLMAGDGRRHDAIVVNLTAAVHAQTRGGPCQTFTGETYVATSATSRRMPELGVDCGKPDEASLIADQPVLLIEVLSPTTASFDMTVKLAEYQTLSTVNDILLVDTESPNVHLYTRNQAGDWKDVVLRGLDAIVKLDKLGVVLELRDIYAGLQLRPKPKLVEFPADEASGEKRP